MGRVTIQNHTQGGYLLSSECFISRSIDEVFAFFSNAANLERLTPPWLQFEILTPAPIEMHIGRLIDYRLRIHGVPLRWQSKITVWDPPYSFADESRRGPYKYWRHNHRFEPFEGGTRVLDEAHYGVPGGALVLFVKRDVQRIFEFRLAKLSEFFPQREQEVLLRAGAG